MRLECDYLSDIQKHYKNYAELAFGRMTRLSKRRALVRQSLCLQIFIFKFNLNSMHKKEAIQNTDKNFHFRFQPILLQEKKIGKAQH